jgi:hypothetical protein
MLDHPCAQARESVPWRVRADPTAPELGSTDKPLLFPRREYLRTAEFSGGIIALSSHWPYYGRADGKCGAEGPP